MNLHTAGGAVCFLLVCTVSLHVHSAPTEGSASTQQTASSDSVSPLTVGPLQTSTLPGDKEQLPKDDTKAKRAIDRDSDSDSDSSSNEEGAKYVNRRSADDDSSNENEETGEDTATDCASEPSASSHDEDDGSTEEAADDPPSDSRRRREAESNEREKREANDDSDEDVDGGLTKEAAVVSPIRRRRAPQGKEDEDISTKEPINYDDTVMDPIGDRKRESSSPRTRRRREVDTSTVSSVAGSPVLVVAPSNVPVKEIPKQLNQTLETLKDRIDHFEDEATAGEPTVQSVGVIAGASTRQDKDTIIHTISSAQYIVH
ncbi:clumping factor A isoform X2 [Cryptotermes secundus]|uniref:clumping factor A isoform X2 n=1 Tax=Cryptotermes secundus TaxID=105785 RepID=UPI001454B9AA|nr:clumping factor A isoform X2 [Cryptotermes secundus]